MTYLSIDQNISLTGGKVPLNTSLDRLDQFNYGTQIYNSNPITSTLCNVITWHTIE